MRLRFLSFPLAAFAVAGCVVPVRPVGHDFPAAAFAGFSLNQTSTEEVEALLGVPWRQSTIRGLAKPDAKFIRPGTPMSTTVLNYMFAPAGAGLPLERHPLKMATLIFFNGRLVSYNYNSLIPGDIVPPVDESRLSSLHQGETTKADAEALLGMPNGASLHILDAQAGATDIAYSSLNMTGSVIVRHTLTISFDKAGKLVTYTVLDNSFPISAGPIPLPFQSAPQPQPARPHNAMPSPDLNHT